MAAARNGSTWSGSRPAADRRLPDGRRRLRHAALVLQRRLFPRRGEHRLRFLRRPPSAAIFLRTVKLKDFPWNGWPTLGVPNAPAAAWNPIGGFTDETGRLIWLALGDPALFLEPYDARWSLNRIGEVTRADR